jgi:hypothetical protein
MSLIENSKHVKHLGGIQPLNRKVKPKLKLILIVILSVSSV